VKPRLGSLQGVALSGSPLRECFDGLRLGNLRACSQVIRAHRVWRVNNEDREARITFSPA